MRLRSALKVPVQQLLSVRSAELHWATPVFVPLRGDGVVFPKRRRVRALGRCAVCADGELTARAEGTTSGTGLARHPIHFVVNSGCGQRPLG